MDLSVVYAKTPKGTRLRKSLFGGMPAHLMKILALIDGKTPAQNILNQLDGFSEQKFINALFQIESEGYIKVVETAEEEEDWELDTFFSPMVVEEVYDFEEIDGKAELETYLELEQIAKRKEAERREDEQKAREVEAQIRAKEKAKAEAKIRQRDAEEQARITREAEMERQKAALEARQQAEMKAKAQAKFDAQEKARIEAERVAKEAELARIHAEAEAAKVKAKLESERQEKLAAEARAQAERIAQEEAEKERANAEAEAHKKRLAEEEARLATERIAQKKALARAQAEQAAREKSERAAQALVERIREKERQRREKARIAKVEEDARIQAELVQAEEAAIVAAEMKAREEQEATEALAKAEEATRLEAERQAELEQEARAQAELAARLEAERLLAVAQAEEAARIDAEEYQRLEDERIAKLAEEARIQAALEAEAAEAAKLEAEYQAKLVAEEQARLDAEHIAREDEAAQQKAAAEARALAEQEAKLEAKRQAKLAAEAKAQEKENAKAQAKLENARLAKEKAEREANKKAEAKAQKEAERLAKKQREAEKAADKAAEKAAREEAKSLASEMMGRRSQRAKNSLLNVVKAKYRKFDILVLSRFKGDSFQAKQPKKWKSALLRLSLVYVPILLIVMLGLMHLMPLNFLVAPIENIATASIGAPVKVSEVRAYIWPQPRYVLHHVTVGESPVIQANSVIVALQITSLLSEVKILNSLLIEGVTLDQKDFAKPLQWLQNANHSAQLQVSDVRFNKVNLNIRDLALTPFSGQVRQLQAGNFDGITLKSENGALAIEVQPQEAQYRVKITASKWALPVQPNIVFDELNANGIYQSERLKLDQLQGAIYGGTFSAKAVVDWSNQWQTHGNFNLTRANTALLLKAFSSSGLVEGRVNLAGEFSAQSNLATQLLDDAEVTGNFDIPNGKISGVDLARAMLNPEDKALAGFATNFDQLSGGVRVKSGRVEYRQLMLKSPKLKGQGQVQIAPDAAISGKISLFAVAQGRDFQSTFDLTGKVSNVKRY